MYELKYYERTGVIRLQVPEDVKYAWKLHWLNSWNYTLLSANLHPLGRFSELLITLAQIARDHY
jgi:hypothetical protein